MAAQVVFDFGPLLREKCVASAHPLRRKCYASQMYIGCASVLNTTCGSEAHTPAPAARGITAAEATNSIKPELSYSFDPCGLICNILLYMKIS